MISIKNLGVKYGQKSVYEDFSLDIEEGKVLCVLGESGCGKTTLLNALSGLIKCSGDFPRLGCSYVFQTPRLLPNLTVEGNLKIVCKDHGRMEKLLKATGLEGKEGSFPCSLSGGEAQRVAIVRAFLKDCDLLLMDEPFSSLGLKLKISIMDGFTKMQRADKKTAVFVTHDIDEALYMADRIVLIKSGKTALDIPNGRGSGYGENPLRGQLIRAILQ